MSHLTNKMRNNNRQLDEVCLDCLNNIPPKQKVDNCNNCPITILKKINNKLLNDYYHCQAINLPSPERE